MIGHCFIAGRHIHTYIIVHYSWSYFILYYYASTWAQMYLYDMDEDNTKRMYWFQWCDSYISETSVLQTIYLSRQQRSGRNIFPATLNNLSTGADEAGNARYLHASCDSWGKLNAYPHHDLLLFVPPKRSHQWNRYDHQSTSLLPSKINNICTR